MRVFLTIIAILSLLFWANGAFDMWATLTNWQPYIDRGGPQAQDMAAWAQGFPLWRKGVWGLAIAAGALASLIMLGRARFAGHLMLLAVASMIVGVVYDFGFAGGARNYGQTGMIATTVILVLAMFFVWAAYANAKTPADATKPVASAPPA